MSRFLLLAILLPACGDIEDEETLTLSDPTVAPLLDEDLPTYDDDETGLERVPQAPWDDDESEPTPMDGPRAAW